MQVLNKTNRFFILIKENNKERADIIIEMMSSYKENSLSLKDFQTLLEVMSICDVASTELLKCIKFGEKKK